MRVFVTGATGFIGSAVVQELISTGHQVIGLTRTEQGAQKLAKMGAQAMPGSLEDLESLRKGAREADGVVHLAFVHALSQVSFSKQVGIFIGGISKGITQSFVSTVVDVDGKAIEAIGSVLQGTQRPFVTALGTLSLKPGQLRTEHDDVDLNGIGGPRGNSEKMMLALASKGIRSSVIRLPPSVHGDDDKGFMSIIIKAAQKNKASASIGDGLNRWPAVHRLDAAHLIRLALEKGAPGARYHGVGDEGVPWTHSAELIGRRLSVPVVSKSGKAASKHFGFLSLFAGIDNPVSSQWTQQQLGWEPKEPGLIADLEQGSYFTAI